MLLIADRDGADRDRRASWAARRRRSADATTDVAIESAIFDPVSIRRTAQRLALRSEASSRFEKGQEPRLARIGADRTAQLVQRVGGRRGRPRPGRHRARRAGADAGHVQARADQPAAGHRAVGRRAARPPVAGRDRDRGGPGRTGDRRAASPSRWSSTRRPPHRARTSPRSTRWCPPGVGTCAIEADVAEEIARVRGYELTPSVTPDTSMPAFRPSPLEVRELVRQTLAGRRPDGDRHDGPGVAAPPRGVRPREPGAVRRRRAPAGGRADHGHEPALARPLDRCAQTPARQPARRGRARTCATASRTSRCSRSARATRGRATSRASGGGSGSRWSGRPSRRPGTARRGPYDLDDAKGLLELLAAPAGPRAPGVPRRSRARRCSTRDGRLARTIARPPACPRSASCTRRPSRHGSSAPATP